VHVIIIIIIIIIIIAAAAAIEFSLRVSSPYTSNQFSKYYHVKNDSAPRGLITCLLHNFPTSNVDFIKERSTPLAVGTWHFSFLFRTSCFNCQTSQQLF